MSTPDPAASVRPRSVGARARAGRRLLLCVLCWGLCLHAEAQVSDTTLARHVRAVVEAAADEAVSAADLAARFRALDGLYTDVPLSLDRCNEAARDSARRLYEAYHDDEAERPPRTVYALDVFANVLARYGPPPREGADVVLAVGASGSVAPRLRVQRTSGPRTPGLAPVSTGARVERPGTSRVPRRRGEAPEPCRTRVFELEDVAPGRFDVRIDLVGVDTKEQITSSALGSFEVGTPGLFGGMITAGVVGSLLHERTFSLVPSDPGADSSGTVLSIDEHPHVRPVVSVHVFSPRVLGGPGRPLRGALTLGFDVQSPLDHFYPGVSLSVRDRIWLTGGAHVGRVRRLPSELAHLESGDPYDAAATVPVVSRFVVRPYVSAGFGLQSALTAAGDALGKLFKR